MTDPAPLDPAASGPEPDRPIERTGSMDYHNFRCDSTNYNTGHARITDTEDLIGKTIAGTCDVYSHVVGLRFTDGTYFYAKAVDGGFSDDGPNLDTEYERPEASEALQMGMIDQAEYDRVYQEQEAQRERYEQAEYRRLKARFEGPAAQQAGGQP